MSTKFNFSQTFKEAEDKYGLGKGEYLKLQEGANRMRILSACLPHSSSYQGRQTFKFMCQVLDRATNKVRLFFMPVTIYKQIESLQADPDYSFDEVPMPFDITVNAKGAGTKEVVYSVIPSPKRTELTPAEQEMLNAAKPIEEVQVKLKENERTQMDEASKAVMDKLDAGEMPKLTPDEFNALHPIAKDAMHELQKAKARADYKARQEVELEDGIPVIEPDEQKIDLKDIPFG